MSDPPTTLTEKDARLFLVAALIAATVSCFIGAHMMAETAAFFTKKEQETLPDKKNTVRAAPVCVSYQQHFHRNSSGAFLNSIASYGNREVELAASLKPISHMVFVGVVIGALCWMALAAIDRMALGPSGWYAISSAFLVGFLSWILCYKSEELLPQVTFMFIVGLAAVSLIYFAIIFKIGKACTRNTGIIETGVFSSAITTSYVSLVDAYFKLL